MREIKFRCWDGDKFHYLTIQPGGTFNRAQPHFAEGFFIVEWQQYTGLKDKNGVEIFEGDVLAFGIKSKDVVRYEGGGFKIENVYLGAGMKSVLPIGDVRIIGNIYENPELLNN